MKTNHFWTIDKCIQGKTIYDDPVILLCKSTTLISPLYKLTKLPDGSGKKAFCDWFLCVAKSNLDQSYYCLYTVYGSIKFHFNNQSTAINSNLWLVLIIKDNTCHNEYLDYYVIFKWVYITNVTKYEIYGECAEWC